MAFHLDFIENLNNPQPCFSRNIQKLPEGEDLTTNPIRIFRGFFYIYLIITSMYKAHLENWVMRCKYSIRAKQI